MKKYMLESQMRGIVARDGHFTSLKLEVCFWHALRYLAIGQDISLQMLLHEVEGNKLPHQSLASAMRTSTKAQIRGNGLAKI
jgi:predicted DNA-binding ribbon-helix-helix protein